MRISAAALTPVLIASPVLAQPPPGEALPEIHPNDRIPSAVQQRLDEIRRHGDVRDRPQMNSLESLQQQQRGSSPSVAPNSLVKASCCYSSSG